MRAATPTRPSALAALLCAAALAPGCVSISSVQTARTLRPGQVQVQGGAGSVTLTEASRSSSFDQNGNEIQGALTESSVPVPEIEFGARFGITDYVDAGLKVSLPSSVMADVKLQLVDTPNFAVAVGAGLGYQSFSFLDVDMSVVDLFVPVYLSYDVSKWIALYASPKYYARIASGSSQTSSSNASDYWHMFGATAGVRVGHDFGLFIEATRLHVLNASADMDGLRGLAQVHVAFFFNVGGTPERRAPPPPRYGPTPAAQPLPPAAAPQPAPQPAPAAQPPGAAPSGQPGR